MSDTFVFIFGPNTVICGIIYGKSVEQLLSRYCTYVPRAMRKPWMTLGGGYTSVVFPARVKSEDDQLAAAQMF